MAANRTQNSHVHRIRHRRRTSDPRNHLRKYQAYLAVQAARLNTVGTVAGVTEAEIEAAHVAAAADTGQSVRARFVRAASSNAEVTALGIPVA